MTKEFEFFAEYDLSEFDKFNDCEFKKVEPRQDAEDILGTHEREVSPTDVEGMLAKLREEDIEREKEVVASHGYIRQTGRTKHRRNTERHKGLLYRKYKDYKLSPLLYDLVEAGNGKTYIKKYDKKSNKQSQKITNKRIRAKKFTEEDTGLGQRGAYKKELRNYELATVKWGAVETFTKKKYQTYKYETHSDLIWGLSDIMEDEPMKPQRKYWLYKKDTDTGRIDVVSRMFHDGWLTNLPIPVMKVIMVKNVSKADTNLKVRKYHLPLTHEYIKAYQKNVPYKVEHLVKVENDYIKRFRN